MESTELYQQILGITAPWFVESVEINHVATKVTVVLAHATGSGLFRCPTCDAQAPIYDHQDTRTWRHLDTCQFQTLLSARVPRVNCRACGVQTARVPWAAPHGRFTLLFECFALDVLLTAQVQSRAAELLRLTPDQVRYLMQRAVERGLQRRDVQRPLPHLMVDEKSLHTGHHYVSVLSDGAHGAVLEVEEHRTTEAATVLFEQGLSASQKETVKVVTLDMWPPFATAARTALPNADLVYDRFHLSEHLNAAVDKTRRQEHKRLSGAGDERLKQTRYLWLRAPETLSDKQREQLETLCRSELETVAVWRLKEEFRGFFECSNEEAATDFFQSWCERVKEVGNLHLSKVAAMFKEHWSGLIAYLRHHVSNGLAESVNGRIQQLKTKARGFRNCFGFRRAILFHLGQLDLYP
ncbi:MAG: ISL3 family transposase [Pyrinomonadaceae bacterium]|nr:ISL3 family transposase [Pyrinomonadaceae bacterium]